MNDNALLEELEKRMAARGYPGAKASQAEVERFLTPTEAAKVLRCSQGLLYSLLRDGQIPAIRMGAKRYAIPVRPVNLIVDVVMASGNCIGLADWKQAWDEYVAEQLNGAGQRQPVRVVA
ncbi:excisionase family DNA-binding protein [Glycomyces salinus]|uniref:excisionase family DNA-binding protein n=1 Tax=Glycomyces salinus TaxID=980294 RepID=UPI0018ECC1D3|nr:helix-turn-helix domain-containing protein [Glycomyces salinus]